MHPTVGSPVTWLNDVINDKLEIFKGSRFAKDDDEDNISPLPETQLENDAVDTDLQWLYVKHCLECLVALKDLFNLCKCSKFQNVFFKKKLFAQVLYIYATQIFIIIYHCANSFHSGISGNEFCGDCVQPPLNTVDALKATDQQNLSRLIQLVFTFGVVPNFLPGVGLPLERRNKFHRCILECNTLVGKNDGKMKRKYEEKKHHMLVYVAESLLNILDHEIFSSIILTKHIGDILAALIQLTYAPAFKVEL